MDASGSLEITDAIAILGFLFIGDRRLACLDAADADDNGVLELTDALRVLGFLFQGAGPPPPPYPAPGSDPTEDDLRCRRG